jgi:hypothetical protein
VGVCSFLWWGTASGEAAELSPDHFIPAGKKLDAAWVRGLFEKGERTWYDGDDLNTIGMPVGGICAGQVYLTGDGKLAYWDVFNQNVNTGFGQGCYDTGRTPFDVCVNSKIRPGNRVEQGVAIKVTADGETQTRALDRTGFPKVRFRGEYPIGYVRFADPAFPVQVELEAFAPFIPLNAADSALPAVLLRYTVKNTAGKTAEVELIGRLENVVCYHSRRDLGGLFKLVQQDVGEEDFTAVAMGAELIEKPPQVERDPVVYADFEGDSYGDWTVSGEAFGTGPAKGAIGGQQPVRGYRGKGLVNTYLGSNDTKQGVLTSPTFTISRRYISFLVGGGNHKDRTCMNLVVDG